MHSYSHLYEKFLSNDNIDLALKNISHNPHRRDEARALLANSDRYKIVRRYVHRVFEKRPQRHKPIQIYDGITRKVRTIIVPNFKEQIVHHMIVNIMQPIIFKGMYKHSYGSIPYRGGHRGRKVIRKWQTDHPEWFEYCLKMDVKKFFDTVDHDILYKKFHETIHDYRFMRVIHMLIDVTEVGLPLGFYTSQWFANWFLQDLDHYIKEELQAHYYMRYMDDMVIFEKSKRKLHALCDKIATFLRGIKLRLKDNWQVFRFSYKDEDGRECGRFLDFMGFRFYYNRVTLRRSIMLKATRKARKLARQEKPRLFEIRQMLSYIGWFKYTNTYKMVERHVSPYVDFNYCKYRLSKHDRRNLQCAA